jgi:hypothetical protein
MKKPPSASIYKDLMEKPEKSEKITSLIKTTLPAAT